MPVSVWRRTAQRYFRAKRAPRLAPAPLHNHEIAFGCGRFARHPFSPRSFRFGAVLRHGWHGRAALRCGVSLRHRASASLPAHGIHPPIRRGALGRDTSRRVRARLGRRLPRTGGGSRSGPARRCPSTCALAARPLPLRRASRAPYVRTARGAVPTGCARSTSRRRTAAPAPHSKSTVGEARPANAPSDIDCVYICAKNARSAAVAQASGDACAYP